MTDHTHRAPDDARKRSQALTFVLDGETYGIDILRVQEIRGWSSVTRIPHTPSCVMGVLNLRGSIVPVVDLRTCFDLAHTEYTTLTVVIVLSIRNAGATRNVGMVVDGVSDVIDVPPDAISPPPDIGSEETTRHIRGIASLGERLVILLDVDRLTGFSTFEYLGNESYPSPAPAVA